MAEEATSSGGYLSRHVGPLSPPASSVHSSQAANALPHPRSRPLKHGGTKEGALIRYLDEGIQSIQHKFAKRTQASTAGRALDGYTSFSQTGHDIETLIDTIWVSGTPGLQIPYLMSLALLTVDCLNAFPAAPRTMFRLLNKLDIAFASLIQGRDFDSGEPLPGFETGRGMSDTEKVRLKSLVERTRIAVVHVMSAEEMDEEEEDEQDEIEDKDISMVDNTTDAEADGPDDMDDDETSWETQTAKVYDRTIVELGDFIGGPPIGIITDD